MGCSSDDPSGQRSGASSTGKIDARKSAERQRLAAALRANLGRRKSQSRDRKTADAAPGKDAADQN